MGKVLLNTYLFDYLATQWTTTPLTSVIATISWSFAGGAPWQLNLIIQKTCNFSNWDKENKRRNFGLRGCAFIFPLSLCIILLSILQSKMVIHMLVLLLLLQHRWSGSFRLHTLSKECFIVILPQVLMLNSTPYCIHHLQTWSVYYQFLTLKCTN
jgi:hypothetical protein